MSSPKQYREAQKAALQQQQAVMDLEALAKSVERCEKTLLELNAELAAANAQFQPPRSTQQDIGYLTALLKCAHKKLDWEKQLTSLGKRTPGVLANISAVMSSPQNPPNEAMRAALARALQQVQAAMERLEKSKMAHAQGTEASGEPGG